jgi:hypothetical protein
MLGAGGGVPPLAHLHALTSLPPAACRCPQRRACLLQPPRCSRRAARRRGRRVQRRRCLRRTSPPPCQTIHSIIKGYTTVYHRLRSLPGIDSPRGRPRAASKRQTQREISDSYSAGPGDPCCVLRGVHHPCRQHTRSQTLGLYVAASRAAAASRTATGRRVARIVARVSGVPTRTAPRCAPPPQPRAHAPPPQPRAQLAAPLDGRTPPREARRLGPLRGRRTQAQPEQRLRARGGGARAGAVLRVLRRGRLFLLLRRRGRARLPRLRAARPARAAGLPGRAAKRRAAVARAAAARRR